MRFALVDSGLGVLPAAMHLRRLCPGAELVLSMDPEGMPWGARTPDDIAERALACAKVTLPWQPDVLVLACNTASVRALDALRTEFEPAIPVVGTVPAIKPAAAYGDPVAIWATPATTGSPYQQQLIRRCADGVQVTEIACPGLAGAIEQADQEAITAAVTAAAASTPPDTRAVVLGCTQYELVMDRIRGVLPRVRLHGSAPAVAAQAIRRLAARPAGPADPLPAGQPAGQAAAPRHAAPAGPAGHSGPPNQAAHARSTGPGTVAGPAGPAGSAASAAGSTGPVGSASAAGWAGSAELADSAGPLGSVAAAGSTGCRDGAPPNSGNEPSALHVLLSGATGELPAAALRYAEGRLLAGLRLPSTAA